MNERKKLRRRPFTLPKTGARRKRVSRSRGQCVASGIIVAVMLLGGCAMVWRHREPLSQEATPKKKPGLRPPREEPGRRPPEEEPPPRPQNKPLTTTTTTTTELSPPAAKTKPQTKPQTQPQKTQPQKTQPQRTQTQTSLMPPFGGAPRADPYLARKTSPGRRPPLSSEECLRHRRAVPTHAKALDLVVVSAAPADAPSLLCVIYTYWKKHPAAKVALETWMPLCDGALALSDRNDTGIVAIPHDGPEAWENIWQKTRANWRYIYEYYRLDFDYFVFGGDDMFVVPSNLKRYLGSSEIRHVTNDGKRPVYLGRRFKANGNPDRIFNSGGAGYVLNRAAVDLLYSQFDQPTCQPRLKGFWEDVMVAQCLRKAPGVPVEAYDTRDPQGRERFHPFQPGHHLTYRPTPNDWYVKYSIDLKFGTDCCSPESVSYHYVKPDLVEHLDALLHRCRTDDDGGGAPESDK